MKWIKSEQEQGWICQYDSKNYIDYILVYQHEQLWYARIYNQIMTFRDKKSATSFCADIIEKEMEARKNDSFRLMVGKGQVVDAVVIRKTFGLDDIKKEVCKMESGIQYTMFITPDNVSYHEVTKGDITVPMVIVKAEDGDGNVVHLRIGIKLFNMLTSHAHGCPVIWCMKTGTGSSTMYLITPVGLIEYKPEDDCDE